MVILNVTGRRYIPAGFIFSAALVLTFSVSLRAADLPLLHFSSIHYRGAFRLPASTFGLSSLNYSEGPLEYNGNNHSIFIVGHAQQQNIAEFSIPKIVNSTVLADLKMASAPLQAFTPVLERASGGNPQSLDRIGGMEFVDSPSGPQLVINAYEY